MKKTKRIYLAVSKYKQNKMSFADKDIVKQIDRNFNHQTKYLNILQNEVVRFKRLTIISTVIALISLLITIFI
jgi:hypothetical protein